VVGDEHRGDAGVAAQVVRDRATCGFDLAAIDPRCRRGLEADFAEGNLVAGVTTTSMAAVVLAV
jgi:hypothetical protein